MVVVVPSNLSQYFLGGPSGVQSSPVQSSPAQRRTITKETSWVPCEGHTLHSYLGQTVQAAGGGGAVQSVTYLHSELVQSTRKYNKQVSFSPTPGQARPASASQQL